MRQRDLSHATMVASFSGGHNSPPPPRPRRGQWECPGERAVPHGGATACPVRCPSRGGGTPAVVPASSDPFPTDADCRTSSNCTAPDCRLPFAEAPPRGGCVGPWRSCERDHAGGGPASCSCPSCLSKLDAPVRTARRWAALPGLSWLGSGDAGCCHADRIAVGRAGVTPPPPARLGPRRRAGRRGVSTRWRRPAGAGAP